MTRPARPKDGAALRTAVTDAMIALHARNHHRVPVTAKARLMDGDVLVCVLGGVHTEVEKTLIELGP